MICPLCKKYETADLCVACVYDTEALKEIMELKEQLRSIYHRDDDTFRVTFHASCPCDDCTRRYSSITTTLPQFYTGDDLDAPQNT